MAVHVFPTATVQPSDVHDSVRTIALANIALSGFQTLAAVLVTDGNRVLVARQTNGAENGLWLARAGAWQRAPDADTSAELSTGASVYVEEGDFQGYQWALSTTGTIIIGTTPQTWTLIRSPAGAGDEEYDCPSTVAVRDAVYFSADNTVDKASRDDLSRVPAIGIVVQKPTSTRALVRKTGTVTGFAALTRGPVYLGASGAVSSTAPASGSGQALQVLGTAPAADRVDVDTELDYLVRQ